MGVTAVSLTIGDLTGFIRADDSGMRRGLSDAELQMRGFHRMMDGQLRDMHGRFVSESEAMGRSLTIVGRQGRDFSRSLGRIASMAGGLASVAGSIGLMAAKLGIAVPLAAGLVATLANVAPAAGLAATGIVAMVLATQALKLGMVGVKEAIGAALDPSKAEEFEKAINKLSPSARAFAREVKALAPEFKKLQQTAQEHLFKGFDNTLRGLAKNTLPVVKKGLIGASDALNRMGKNVAVSANNLSSSGALGTAVSSATAGLKNLSRVPGQIVLGLGQIAGAAGPAFKRLTGAAAGALDRISATLSTAFASGAMQRAIEQAISLIGDLAEIAGNVFDILGSLFDAARASGGGFIGVLQQITAALAAAFASGPVQAGLRAIFQTMSVLAQTAAPLLISALKVIAPIFTALGPPIQTVIRALGAGLQPVITALGPVLAAAAKAFGSLIVAASPLLVVAGQLVASLLPALTPLFDALTTVFTALAPIILQVANTLRDTLTPILAALPGIIGPLAALIADQLVLWLGLFGDLLVELSPSLITLGEALGELLVALGPLIAAWALLSTELLTALMPLLQPLVALIGWLATVLADDLARVITDVVVPAVNMISAVLRGDFSGALTAAKAMVTGFVSTAVARFTELPQRAARALTGLVIQLRQRANEAGLALIQKLVEKRDNAVARIRELPGLAARGLGNLGSTLAAAGSNLIEGFIRGIRSKIPSVQGILNGITAKLSSWKGPESLDKKILTPAGRYVIEGFQRGIADQIPALRAQLQGVTGELPGMALGGGAGAAGASGGAMTLRIEMAGPDEVTRLIRRIVKNDGGGNVQIAFGRG